MIKIMSNGSKWLGQDPDTLEELCRVLAEHPLDPVFEMYGGFVNRNPQWISEEIAEEYSGCTVVGGNFLTYSHVFYIVTDEEAVIDRIEHLITENKKMPRYIEAKTTRVKSLWAEFGDIPMNPETECIEEEWRGHPVGTHREEIWYWFEETFNVSVAELMGFK